MLIYINVHVQCTHILNLVNVQVMSLIAYTST